MAYALDRLGWLQFQQLCAKLLELDAGIAESAWTGDADRSRFVRSDDDLGPMSCAARARSCSSPTRRSRSRCGSSLDLAAARELATVFAPARAHRHALVALAEHHFAVLTASCCRRGPLRPRTGWRCSGSPTG